MRYLSLHLPCLATDRIRRRLGTSTPPDAPDRPIVTVAKVKSAFRLAALDARALALGLRPMTALADARAMYPALDAHDADPDGDAAARDALVDWCRRFTPLAAPDGDDGAILDISGVAHLFGGEAALIEDMTTRLARQGFAAKVAIAGTTAAAWALARYGGGNRLIEADLAPAALAKRFAPMPLAALRIAPPIIAQLGQAGLRRIGDLMLRPRAPIAARFGRAIHHRLDLLLGTAKDPISPRFEAPPFVAERRFAEGLARREDLEATIFALAHDLCGLLARHGEGARRLDVTVYRVDGLVKHIEAGTSRALRDPLAMARLFHERLEALGEDGLDTGYGFDVIRLAALSAERLDAIEPSWADATAHEAELADLVDRLGARFGLARVTRLAPADAHQPAAASIALPGYPPLRSKAQRRRGTEQSGGADCASRARLQPSAAPSTAFHAVPLPRCAEEDPRGIVAPNPPLRGSAGEGDHAQHGGGGGTRFVPGAEPPSPTCEGGTDALPERPLRLFERPEPIVTIAAVPDGPPLRFQWRRVTHHVAAIEGPERIGSDWWRQDQRQTIPRDYFRAEDTEGRRFWLYREGLYRETPEPRWFLHGLFA